MDVSLQEMLPGEEDNVGAYPSTDTSFILNNPSL